MSVKKWTISDIKVKFGGKYPPKDEKAIELFKRAYDSELLVCIAMIKIEGIKPFSDYIPKIKGAIVRKFQVKDKEGFPPPIYVYPENGKFIMSDDWCIYHLYLITGHRKIPCIVLGDAEGEYVTAKSEPFHIPPPAFEMIEEVN